MGELTSSVLWKQVLGPGWRMFGLKKRIRRGFFNICDHLTGGSELGVIHSIVSDLGFKV